MDRGPFDYPISHYLAFWSIGALGHLAAQLQYIAGTTAPPCWICIAVRVFVVAMTGGLVGVMTFWAGEGLHVPMHFTAAAAGIAGHMGVKSFELGETLLLAFIERMKRSIDLPKDDKHD